MTLAKPTHMYITLGDASLVEIEAGSLTFATGFMGVSVSLYYTFVLQHHGFSVFIPFTNF